MRGGCCFAEVGVFVDDSCLNILFANRRVHVLLRFCVCFRTVMPIIVSYHSSLRSGFHVAMSV